MSKTAAKKEIDVIREIAEDLFSKIGIVSKPDVSMDKDGDSYLINIGSEEESGLLIGNRGRTLSSLQTVVGLLVRQKLGEWKRIVLNVSDYREKEEQRLILLATRSAERAKATGEKQLLYNLTPAQRRIVHMALAKESGIKTESEGEGNDRYLVVSSEA
jgi:predicted RNA-binding protein Jag